MALMFGRIAYTRRHVHTLFSKGSVLVCGGGGGGGEGAIDSVPQAEQVACCYDDAQTNKPTKRDGGVVPCISTLHNADKASAGHPIG